jgi:hypothetical protein
MDFRVGMACTRVWRGEPQREAEETKAAGCSWDNMAAIPSVKQRSAGNEWRDVPVSSNSEFYASVLHDRLCFGCVIIRSPVARTEVLSAFQARKPLYQY